MYQRLYHYRWLIVACSVIGLMLIFVLNRNVVRQIEAAYVIFHPSEQILAAASSKGVQIWQLPQRTLIGTLDTGGYSHNVTWGPEGDTIAAVGPNHTTYVWRTSDYELLTTLPSPGKVIDDIAFSSNGQIIAVTSRDRFVRLWDAYNGQLLQSLRHDSEIVTSIDFSPDGQLLASGAIGMYMWDWRAGAETIWPQADYGDIRSLVFSVNGDILVSGDGDGVLRIWNVQDAHLTHQLQEETSAISAIAVSPDNRYIATGNGVRRDQGLDPPLVQLWDLHEGTLLKTFRGHTAVISSVTFSPDSRLLISAGENGGVRAWKLP